MPRRLRRRRVAGERAQPRLGCEPVNDTDCTAFLQWALPRIDLRWPSFRQVRKQVCKPLVRRMHDLQLSGFAAYRARLEIDPTEWQIVDECCHITISRFFRDRGVFEFLRSRVLPEIASRAQQEARNACIWSAGCASGEEPHTLRTLWDIPASPTSDFRSGPGCGTSSAPSLKTGWTITPFGLILDRQHPASTRSRSAGSASGQKIAYVTDAADNPANRDAIIGLARHADLLFIEGAFTQADAALAAERAHLTTVAARRIAREAGVRRIEPFHFSPRYAGEEQCLPERGHCRV